MVSRAEKALATRRRMVRTAYDQFCANGYGGTTIEGVARAAGVAVPTIYYTFGTKAALLGEALGAAVLGFDIWRPPPEPAEIGELLPWHDWWDEFVSAPTSAEALDVLLAHGAEVLERCAPLVAALHGAAGDPAAAEVARIGEQRRVDAYREAVRWIASKDGGLRRGLTTAAAVDILLVLFSAELYHALRSGRRWSAKRCRELLRDLVTAQLLPDCGDSAP